MPLALDQFFGSIAPHDLVRTFGSPLYVYNESVLRERAREVRSFISHPGFSPHYSTKANGNPHLLRIIREEGLQADAMSPGEIAMLKAAGYSKQEIGYVCNNVSAEELLFATQEAAWVSVDSLAQLELLGQVAPGAAVVVRVNPGIGAGHHDKVITAGKKTKFGVHPDDFMHMRTLLKQYDLRLIGLNQHVGSLFMEPEPYLAAAEWLLALAESFDALEIIDFGGGFGISYTRNTTQQRLNLADLGLRLGTLLHRWCTKTGYSGKFFVEPGRYVVAECGVLLGSVHAVKNNGEKRFVGTDLGFSVLARPVLYDAYHELDVFGPQVDQRPVCPQTVVGNICESGDVMAHERLLPEAAVHDVIGVCDAGAYGMVMASNYNQRLRPAEVLITAQGDVKLLRRRDTVEDLLQVYCLD